MVQRDKNRFGDLQVEYKEQVNKQDGGYMFFMGSNWKIFVQYEFVKGFESFKE